MTLNEPVLLSSGGLQVPLADREKSDVSPSSPLYAMHYFLELGHSEHDKYQTAGEFVRRVFSTKFKKASGSTPLFKDKLSISPLKGGITNMLLQGTYQRWNSTNSTSTTPDIHQSFLIRTYGNGTDSIIDRDREFSTHLCLHSLQLAPPLYARFGNGLIYDYIPGQTIHYTDLSDTEVMESVANRLAQWHVMLESKTIEKKIGLLKAGANRPASFVRDIWELLLQWVDILPQGILDLNADELRDEIEWIKGAIGSASPMAVSHCDLLSGNILVPETWAPKHKLGSSSANLNYRAKASSNAYQPSQLVSFIDYEYTMPSPRAFDLANHFMEWQGFDCKTELIQDPSPTNPVIRFWVYHYLAAESHYKHPGNSFKPPSEDDIDGLIFELVSWWGMPGFYWGIWSAIQSTISDIDFDYADYASKRLNEYKLWKKNIYPNLQGSKKSF